MMKTKEGTTVELGPDTKDIIKPEHSPKKEKKKLQFYMADKVKIIQGQLNFGYLATFEGVLKIAEIILSFTAFVLATCADRRTTTWTEHQRLTTRLIHDISFSTLLIPSSLLFGYVVFPNLTIKDETMRVGLLAIEMIFYGGFTLFYFCSIWFMDDLSASWGNDGRGAATMTAVICVVLTVLFAIETIVKLKEGQATRKRNTNCD